MQHSPSHDYQKDYNMGGASELRNFLYMKAVGMTETVNGEISRPDSIPMAEVKAASKKVHKEAEQRRRNRIGAHYESLRSLLPKTIKTQKASVLAEAIKLVTELKMKTTQLAELHHGCTEDSAFPGDTDVVKVGYCEGDSGVVKATLCCEDRKELMADLIRALKTVRGKLVRAEIGTIGGRTKSLIWVRVLGGGGDDGGGGGGGDEGEDVLGSIRRALNVVIDRPIVSRLGQGNKRTCVSH